MNNPKLFKSICRISSFLILILAISINAFAQQNLPENLKKTNLQAQALVKQDKYIDAVPLMDQLAPYFSKDSEFMAFYGIAITTNAVTFKTSEERNKEMKRGVEVLKKAKELGTKNVKALYLLDNVPEDGKFQSDLTEGDSPVAEALREGEGFFGRGEFEKAYTAYEKAYKLDPKNYEAIVFMGDSLYSQRKFAESEVWFAKATELEPNRELAFRYWGDALLYQKRYAAALDKFAEAMIAEPFSRMTWDSFKRWGELSEARTDLIDLSPPGNKVLGEIIVRDSNLNVTDGTIYWRLYNEVRVEQIKKNSLKNSRHTLGEEYAAWKKVADAVRDAIKNGTVRTPNANLINLVKVADAGLLEPYILLLRGQEDFADDYTDYRTNNRAKMKKFIIEFMFGIVEPTIERNVT